MLLIFSFDGDFSTSQVILWLIKYNVEFARTNIAELKDNNLDMTYYFNNNNESTSHHYMVSKKDLLSKKTQAVWYRRKALNFEYAFPNMTDIEQSKKTRSNLEVEKTTLSGFLLNKIDNNTYWLNSHDRASISKLEQLEKAVEVGLTIPETLVTNQKKELERFIYKHKEIITKPIQKAFDITYEEKKYMSLTKRLKINDLPSIPETFFPSLFQENIEKEYEIRTFYIEGDFYSLAIFSQKDQQTSEDFRNYNYKNPNRTTAYQLPEEICEKLHAFMQKVKLNCGSFDLIFTPDEKYVFLEVNPVGQFGFVSYPGNYYIERKIANIFKEKLNERITD